MSASSNENEKPTQPSGMSGESECPSDHNVKNYVVDNPCNSCKAQV